MWRNIVCVFKSTVALIDWGLEIAEALVTFKYSLLTPHCSLFGDN